jgi:hypothetical protein
MKMTTLKLGHSVNRSPFRLGLLLLPLALACFALAPQARAVCREGCDTSNVQNTFLGDDALVNSEAGLDNTAIGFHALENNMGSFFTGSFNTAVGAGALSSNTTGSDNTTTGKGGLGLNTTGSSNTAIGETALYSNTTGNSNIAVGNDALFNNTTGSSNIALGIQAGVNLSTGSNNIDIGNAGVTGETGKIRIGTRPTQRAAFIAGISGVTVANGVGVIINTQGQLGTIVSSERFKDEIKPMNKASEAILALNPVTFRYKHELDPAGIPQFGLVAEEVEKVNPDLVAPDEQGKPYTVRYEAVNAMLLNEFLKEHRQVENQQRKIESLEKAMAEQEKENAAVRAILSEQAAQIQKVSAQLELSKPAPQTVANNP